MNECTFSERAVESELSRNGIYASVTRGDSMRPLFKTNRDMIILKTPDTEQKKYDVVLYCARSGKYVLHRIVKVLPDEYLIRGDNTFIIEHVAKDRIIGVLTEFNRRGKRRSVRDRGYRLYSRLWNFIYPVRYLYHCLRVTAGKIYRKLFKRK